MENKVKCDFCGKWVYKSQNNVIVPLDSDETKNQCDTCWDRADTTQYGAAL